MQNRASCQRGRYILQRHAIRSSRYAFANARDWEANGKRERKREEKKTSEKKGGKNDRPFGGRREGETTSSRERVPEYFYPSYMHARRKVDAYTYTHARARAHTQTIRIRTVRRRVTVTTSAMACAKKRCTRRDSCERKTPPEILEHSHRSKVPCQFRADLLMPRLRGD